MIGTFNIPYTIRIGILLYLVWSNAPNRNRIRIEASANA